MISLLRQGHFYSWLSGAESLCSCPARRAPEHPLEPRWQFWKRRLCWIQVPVLAVMGEGDARLAAQPSPAVSDHCGDVLVTAELGNDFTLLLLCSVSPDENTASQRGMWI